eukprot:1160313-Pleurochrysis_carterae.AAC.2
MKDLARDAASVKSICPDMPGATMTMYIITTALLCVIFTSSLTDALASLNRSSTAAEGVCRTVLRAWNCFVARRSCLDDDNAETRRLMCAVLALALPRLSASRIDSEKARDTQTPRPTARPAHVFTITPPWVPELLFTSAAVCAQQPALFTSQQCFSRFCYDFEGCRCCRQPSHCVLAAVHVHNCSCAVSTQSC